MRSLASELPDDPRGAEARKRLAHAYHMVFMEAGVYGEMVLADLADYCAYDQVVQDATSPLGVFVDHNARRAVFGRISHFLNLSEDERRELIEAARRETRANALGEI